MFLLRFWNWFETAIFSANFYYLRGRIRGGAWKEKYSLMIGIQLFFLEVSKFTSEIRRKRSLNMGVSFNLEEQDGGIDREPSSSLSSWWSWRWEGLNAPRVDSSSCQQQVPKQEVEDREVVTIWIRTAVTGFHRHPPAILIPQPHSLFFADFVFKAKNCSFI